MPATPQPLLASLAWFGSERSTRTSPYTQLPLPPADWHVTAEEENQELWEADWDDEDLAQDFQGTLRAELDKSMKE